MKRFMMSLAVILGISFISKAYASSSSLQDVSCADSYCVALGIEFEGAAPAPLLLESYEPNPEWHRITSFPFDPSETILALVDCSSVGCVAVGATLLSTPAQPLVMSGRPGVTPWTLAQDIEDIESLTSIDDLSCSDRTCIMLARTATQQPVVLQSSDAGVTWKKTTLPAWPQPSENLSALYTADCDAQFCTIIGRISHTSGTFLKPAIMQSTNGGKSWAFVSLSIDGGDLFDVACTNERVCAAVGHNNNYEPVIYQTINQGANWTIVNIVEAKGGLYSIDCADLACIASGGSLLLETSNAVTSPWTMNHIETTATTLGVSTSKMYSAAVGNYLPSGGSTDTLFVANKIGAEGDWETPSEPFAIWGGFTDVDCNVARCVVVGGAVNADANYDALLLQTVHGNEWEQVKP